MANANSTLSSDAAIRLRTYAGSHCNFYRGTETELVEAGIVKSEWLPGLHGNTKTSTRVGLVEGEMRLLPCGVLATRFQKNNGLIHIFRASKRTFRVEVRKPQEEIDREEAREIEERKQRNLRDKVERMHAEKKRALENAPKNPGDFLKKKSRKIQDFMEDIHNLFMRAENGFHYAPEIVEEARDLIADLVSLAANGRVCFDPVRQKYFLDDIEEKAEKAHPEFSAFMKATLAVGKAAL